jgi:hypothetical protein
VYNKMADVPEPGYRKYWRQKLSSLKSQCHAITNKYSEAASVLQQVHKMLGDTEILVECTLTKVGEISQWTTILKRAEEIRANFCKFLDGKPPFSALYGMYTATLNELKTVLMVSAQAGQSGAVNKTSLE